ncbi:MAG TPA: xanthine dehydrogenase family protein molybdopterin-binding subunit [Actinomycetes bacterium]|jgi:carbon-monoxide dehydrogenase large subunit|nr:xanthine dehydrogenase family protein molybdopterin-binding subunit [Actinomycetes bacterium]
MQSNHLGGPEGRLGDSGGRLGGTGGPVGGAGGRVGGPVGRVEDPPLVTGAARYTDDLAAPGALHAAFVRSVVAHALVTGIDTAEAAAMPGVAGVFTAADLGLPPLSPDGAPAAFARPVLATERVRFLGEALAVVVADTRAAAVDAAELVGVDYEPLAAVTDPVRALDPGAPVLFPEHGSNLVVERPWRGPPAGLDEAEVVVRARFVNQRLAPVPMEPGAALAVPDPETGGITLWTPCQAPFSVREEVAAALGLDEELVRVVSPAAGGGFGARIAVTPEQLVVAALALRLGRPVRHAESRSETMLAMTHGRAQVQEVELGAGADGILSGLRVRLLADCGAYPLATYLPELTRRMASGVYRIPRIEVDVVCVATNTTPVASYRGAGRPEATALLERAVDLLAAELRLDPAELRRRNLIPADAFPYRTASGASYDSGDYAGALRCAVEAAGYEDLRAEQAERRRRGAAAQLGIGLSVYVEMTGWQSEVGVCTVGVDGRVTVATGTSPQGQGHETAWAQLVAGTLGLPGEAVRVVHSDTGRVPRGNGTMGSRSLQIGGSAVLQAGQRVLAKARELAAHLLEAPVEDVVVFEGEGLGVAGAPETALSWARLAEAAADPAWLPPGMEPGLSAEVDFEQAGNTFPFGAHLAVAEVDVETGRARLVRHVAVDDCGRILNPMLVEGQVHGGIAQGVAQALFEEVRYDEEGNCVTGTLASYAMPSAADLPGFETMHTETPTPLNPLGAKGIGESGTIGSTPAVHNAVVDALAHLGVTHVDMPLTPERVWRAIQAARR